MHDSCFSDLVHSGRRSPVHFGRLRLVHYHPANDTAADILFCSDERLPEAPEAWVRTVSRRYDPAVQVVGLGAAGALLAERGKTPQHVPALATRPVVNTIGAGDSLFSAFLHGWLQSGGDALRALRLASVFASWKVGGNGGADGFLTAAELQRLANQQGIFS